MKCKKFVLAVVTGILMALAHLSWAHPGRKIELTYDPATEILEVKIDHVSSRLTKHYIRLLKIEKNGVELVSRTLPTQTSPEGLVQNVPVSAQAGDTIKVKAYSTEGGISEESLVVPEPSDDQGRSK